MAFVPNSGAVSTDIISDVFGLGDDFNNYRGTKWYYPANLVYGFFSSGTLKSSDFYGKQPNDPATSGTIASNVAGSGSFIVPLYRNYIKIEIWGAGGGGASVTGSGSEGGSTSIANTVYGGVTTTVNNFKADGGNGGERGVLPTPPPPASYDRGGGRLPEFRVDLSTPGAIFTYSVDSSGARNYVATYDVSRGGYIGSDGGFLGPGGPEGTG